MSVDYAAHRDPERLREVYERADGDLQTVFAAFPTISSEAIRKALVRNGIHEPVEYTSYVRLLEEMSVEEFDRRVGGDEE